MIYNKYLRKTRDFLEKYGLEEVRLGSPGVSLRVAASQGWCHSLVKSLTLDLSRNHAVGREVVAKQIFAPGEEAGARRSFLDL